jgi:hypothetical protein
MTNVVQTYRDKYEKPNSELTKFRHFVNTLKDNIKVMLPCEVLEVDHTKQHVDLKILAKDTDDLGNVLDFPILPNIPIRYTCETSKAIVRTPIQVGDTGTVEFFDSSIEKYKLEGIVEYHYIDESHTLTDGVFTSGFVSEVDVFTPTNPTDPLIIMLKNNKFELRSDNNGNVTMNVTGNVDLNVTGNADIDVTGNVDLLANGTVNVKGLGIVTVECTQNLILKSALNIVLDSPLITMKGSLTTDGGTTTLLGNLNMNGDVNHTGNYYLNTKNLKEHNHGGVTVGGGYTQQF